MVIEHVKLPKNCAMLAQMAIDKADVPEFVKRVAELEGYNPRDYGMVDPSIYKKGKDYWATWKRHEGVFINGYDQ